MMPRRATWWGEARSLRRQGHSRKAVARRFGVTVQAVDKACSAYKKEKPVFAVEPLPKPEKPIGLIEAFLFFPEAGPHHLSALTGIPPTEVVKQLQAKELPLNKAFVREAAP